VGASVGAVVGGTNLDILTFSIGDEVSMGLQERFRSDYFYLVHKLVAHKVVYQTFVNIHVDYYLNFGD